MSLHRADFVMAPVWSDVVMVPVWSDVVMAPVGSTFVLAGSFIAVDHSYY